jgi:hypothetical protein
MSEDLRLRTTDKLKSKHGRVNHKLRKEIQQCVVTVATIAYNMCKIVYSKNKINKTGDVRTNVTKRRVRVTIVAVRKQQALSILSVCLQPQLSGMQKACAVLYCHLWPVWLYHIFPHYLTNGTIL